MTTTSRRELLGALAGAAGLAIAVAFGSQDSVGPTFPFGLWLGALCLVIAVEDLRHLRVADSANALLFAGGCAWQVLQSQGAVYDALGFAMLGSVVCGGALLALRALHARLSGRIGLGLGDVKFCAAAAAWTGLAGFPFMLLLASLTALIVVGLMSVSQAGWRMQRRLPFAAFLAPALFLFWLASAPFAASIVDGLL